MSGRSKILDFMSASMVCSWPVRPLSCLVSLQHRTCKTAATAHKSSASDSSTTTFSEDANSTASPNSQYRRSGEMPATSGMTTAAVDVSGIAARVRPMAGDARSITQPRATNS